MNLSEFKITLKSDTGKVNFNVTASCRALAIIIVCNAQNAPRNAVLKAKRTKVLLSSGNFYSIHISREGWHSSQWYECFADRPTQALKKCIQDWKVTTESIKHITKLF